MKKFLIILMGIVIMQDAIAQNTLDKIWLTANTTSAVAYSLRQLSSGYTGPAISVRRSTDDAIQEIGFTVAGELDTDALLSFTGNGNSYVNVWYDQSGNGRNMQQDDINDQPQIIFNGEMKFIGSKPTIDFSGDKGLIYTGTLTLSSIVSVVKSEYSYWPNYHAIMDGSPRIGGILDYNGNTFHYNPYPLGVWKNGNEVGVNGSLDPVNEPMSLSISCIPQETYQLFIGNYDGGSSGGSILETEAIGFTSLLEPADRQTISCSQGGYYGFATACGAGIYGQPSVNAVTACLGGTIAPLTVLADGQDLSYQWYSNSIPVNTGGSLIDGATSSSFTPPTNSVDSNYYYVEVTEAAFGLRTSDVSGKINIISALTATVSTTNPTCLVNGTISILKSSGPSLPLIETDFSSLPFNATLSGTAVITGGECILNTANSGEDGMISFSPVAGAPTVFNAGFKYRVADGSGADGTSFNYGILSPGGLYEYGIVSSGLVVRMIEYGDQRIEIVYNDAVLITIPFILMDTSYRNYQVIVSEENTISVIVDGVVLIAELPLPAEYFTADKSSWQFAFASRNGGSNNRHSLTDLMISENGWGNLTDINTEYSLDNIQWQINPVFSVPGGDYTLYMQMNNGLACPSTEVGTASLISPVAPTIEISGLTSGFDLVTLTASGADTYNWSGGNAIHDAINSFNMSGTYQVVVTNPGGCSDSTTTNVTIYHAGLNIHGTETTDSAAQVNMNGRTGSGEPVDKNGRLHYTVGNNGLTATTPGSSAYQIKRDYPESTDGIYWIRNDQVNSGIAFRVYADMTTDGGGWTLILCNVSPDNGWDNDNALLRNETDPSLENKYSIIGWADHIKKSGRGFQYMIDAAERHANGGIWTANYNYSFTSQSNNNTNITLNTKFGNWEYADSGIEERMPWYAPGNAGIVTTSSDANGEWWGTLVGRDGYDPVPWIAQSTPSPGILWYWVR